MYLAPLPRFLSYQGNEGFEFHTSPYPTLFKPHSHLRIEHFKERVYITLFSSSWIYNPAIVEVKGI